MHVRRYTHGLIENALIGFRVSRRSVTGLQEHAHIGTEQGSGSHIHIYIGTYRISAHLQGRVPLLVLVAFNNTVLIVISCHQRITKNVRTTVDTNVRLRVVCMVFGDNIPPIHIGIEFRVGLILVVQQGGFAGKGGSTLLGIHFVNQFQILHTADVVGYLDGLRKGVFEADVHLRLSNLAALGLNHHYTIGTAHTIDGTGGSILQHGEGGDFFRVDVVERTLDAVHQYQRIGIASKATDTTNPEVGVIEPRVTATLNRNHTGNHTRQVVTERTAGSRGKLGRLDIGDGTDHRSFLLRSKAHYHHFIKGCHVFFQSYIKHSFGAYRYHFVLEADIRELQ